jgi:hypothetical protein
MGGSRSWHSPALSAPVVRAPVLTATVAALLLPLAAVDTAARASAVGEPILRQVSYRGYSFEVPGSWPVIDLTRRPRECVRFDRHAVYLGAPGTDEACPSRLVGTTEALVVQPAAARAPQSSVENPVARRITVTAPRIRVTATFDTDPTQIYQILASAFLPAPIIQPPSPAALSRRLRERGTGTRRQAARPRAAMIPRPLPAQIANYHGLGFDTCTAPSTAQMQAWLRRSPYRAIGIYIGGSDEACAQPNLTAGWLRREAAAGWHFLPMYVGPQADFGELSATPGQQGRAAANDAVAQAERLGLGPGTPLYYDMEAYLPGQTGAVLRFESAWTTVVHGFGYSSGIYSSSSSGIADLARQYFGHKYAIPDIIYDALWNGRQNTSDSVFSPGEWANHRRVHQFAGNVVQTFGGDTINVDQDFMDVSLPGPGGTSQATPAIMQDNGVVDVFYRGSDDRLWYVRYAPGSGWARPVALAEAVRAAPTAVSHRGGQVDVFYQGPGGGLWQVARGSGGRWSAPIRLARMGVIGAPSAVVQGNGVIDIFWKGPADGHLRHAHFSPVRGWSGPQLLGGSLASAPSPVESSPGTVEVFWMGADRSLWHVTHRAGRAWTRPASLGMGPLGGAPRATAAASGATEVFWRGARDGQIWFASFTVGRGWQGPRLLGGQPRGEPAPMTSATGSLLIFFRGQDGELWQATGAPGKGWHAPVRQHVGMLGATPFVAIGDGTPPIGVFWKGPSSRLWSASFTGRAWTRPQPIGGVVALDGAVLAAQDPKLCRLRGPAGGRPELTAGGLRGALAEGRARREGRLAGPSGWQGSGAKPRGKQSPRTGGPGVTPPGQHS